MSDTFWEAMQIIIPSITGIFTIILNYKLNKNNRETEAIAKTVGEIKTDVDVVGKNVDGKISLLLEEKDKVLEASKLSEHAAGEKKGWTEATELAEKTAEKVIERADTIVQSIGEKVMPIVEKATNDVVEKIGEKVDSLIKRDDNKTKKP